ncbi:MAG: hypothetical protein R3A79_00135 [Nannocystaceae bacterium]
MPRPRRLPRSTHSARLCALAALLAAACGPEAPQPSRLQDRAQEAREPAPEAAQASAGARGEAVDASHETRHDTGAEAPKPAAKLAGGLLKAGKTDGPSATLRFALPDDTIYQITTVGLVQYPAMPKPTAFARREELRLTGCAGADGERTCSLEHMVTNFEAEPPYGRFIEADEQPVRGVTTRYKVDARGAPVDAATLEAPPETAQTPEVKALSDVDRLFCVRFPEVPVHEGAAWEVECVVRNDGRQSTRRATWEVVKIADGDDGHTRVELKVLGTTTAMTRKGEQSGTFGGTLFFFADIGEPHLLREEISTQVAQEGGIRTVARLNYQFAKRRGDEVVRTDGTPFPEGTAPPPPGAGATGAAPATPI